MKGIDKLDFNLIAKLMTMNAVGRDVEIFGGNDLLAVVIDGVNNLDTTAFVV